MTSLTIRPAQIADSPAIARIWNPQIRSSLTTFNAIEKSIDEIDDLIVTRPCFYVAAEHERVVGFATYDQFRGGIGYAHTMEHTIIIDAGAEGRGVGRALMQAVLKHARDGGVHSIMAGVSGENPAGIGFHAALGFEMVARLPEVGRKFDQWIDLILMQKRL